MTRHRMVAIGIAALSGFCLVIGSLCLQSSAAASDAKPSNFAIRSFDRTMGNPGAPVVLIEYGSPTCPHCAEFYTQYFASLRTKYIDTGAVRYVYRVYLLRADDGVVEKLARCMPADRYFPFIGALFEKQPQWDAAIYPNINMHDALIRLAAENGLGARDAEKCIRDPALNQQLNQVSAEAEARYGVNGTPTFLVNGVPGQAGEQWPHLEQRLMAAAHPK